MSTVCAKTARRKSTRTKRGRPAAADFPMPFSELPLRLQDAAIKSFRNKGHIYDYFDADFLQENLGEVLEYEFGLEPEYESFKGKDGKNQRGNPRIFWDAYNHVEFEVEEFDIHEVLKHARNDKDTLKQFGTSYYRPEAEELAGLWATVAVLESVLGVDFHANYQLKEGKYSSSRVEWEWPGGFPYPYKRGDNPDYDTACDLVERIDEALKDYYEAACSRLRKCIEDEEEYRYSDEGISELLEGNDHWLFDEEGSLA